MSLIPQHRQEDLSVAYILAVAAKAGYNGGRISGHDYGIDIEIRAVESFDNVREETGLALHIQAKASNNFSISADNLFVIYNLDVKNYNRLVRMKFTPAILVLYCMPRDQNEWMSVHEEYTTLKHCGYWISLKGLPPSENEYTQNIKIPKQQVFNESSLETIMNRIAVGDAL